MKVLLMNLNGRGGMLHYSSQFSNALARVAEIRVVVPSYADTHLYEKNIVLWKIRTNPTLASFIVDTINIFAHLKLIYRIWKFRPDILQIMDNHPWYFFYPLIGKLIGASIYVIQHDPFPHSGEKKGLFHAVAIRVNSFLRKRADTLIVHGEKMREKVIKMYGIPKERVKSILHGTYELFLGNVTKEKKKPNTFLFFGRIVEYKGLDILLDALRLLEKDGRDFHAIIAGDGDMTPYKKAVASIDKNHITIMNRFIEDSEIPSFFEQSHFVVLPYKDATASGIIPLAYSFHLPVIATDVGVFSDYVIHDETGIFIPPDNALALSKAIVELLDNTDIIKKLGENAFQFQKERLNWDSIIHSLSYVE